MWVLGWHQGWWGTPRAGAVQPGVASDTPWAHTPRAGEPRVAPNGSRIAGSPHAGHCEGRTLRCPKAQPPQRLSALGVPPCLQAYRDTPRRVRALTDGTDPPPRGQPTPMSPSPSRPPLLPAYLGAGPGPGGGPWRGRRSGASRCPGAHGRCRGRCSHPSPPPRRPEQPSPRGMARARAGRCRGGGKGGRGGGAQLSAALPAAPVGLSPAPRRALSRGGRAPPPAAGPAA